MSQRRISIDMQEGPELFVSGNPCKQVLRQLFARQHLVTQRVAQLGHAHLMQGATHSITFGTRNRPSSTAGALRWFSTR